MTIKLADQDYPTTEELKQVRTYRNCKDYSLGCHELLMSLEQYFLQHGAFKRKGNSYYLATGGWSGCEVLIGALQLNYLFWGLCWQKSARGGAYWFKVPKIGKSK